MPRITLPLTILKILLAGFFIFGCSTSMPLEDYTLARAAMEAAREAEAARYSPGLWFKAEDAYKRGEKEFKDKHFGAAQKSFLKAKQFAERAENAARLSKFETGKGGP